jgi:hypothetical protein
MKHMGRAVKVFRAARDLSLTMRRRPEKKQTSNCPPIMKKKILLSAMAMCAALAGVRADIIPTNLSEVPEGTNFRWNYNTNVTVEQRVEPGDFFTIYDFGALIPFSNLQPANWVFSTALVGITPAGVLPNDDPNVMNITWTYMGTTPINGSAFLGLFSVLSTTNQMRTDNFAAQGTRNTGPQAGTKVSNIGLVGVPVPEMSALMPVLAICGLGLLGFVGSLRRRTIG